MTPLSPRDDDRLSWGDVFWTVLDALTTTLYCLLVALVIIGASLILEV